MPRISGTVPGLDPDTTYDFQVRVVDALGNVGDWSNTAQGTTLPQSGGFLYFQGIMFSESIYTVHNFTEFRFIVTITGVGTYTLDRDLTPQIISYNGRDIIYDDAGPTGVSSISDPNDPNAISVGEWIGIDLAELRLAYPSLTTITVEVKAVGTRLTSQSTVNPPIGAWGHVCSGDPVFWDQVSPEPPGYVYMPFQLSPEGQPGHDPSVSILESDKLNTSSYAEYTYTGALDWASMAPSLQTIATFEYDDANGTMTVS
jgi:hypothetical protein